MLPEASANNKPAIDGCTSVHPYNPIGILSFDTAVKNKRRDKPPDGNLFLHNSFSLQLFKKAKWRCFPVSSTQKRESPEAL